MMFIKPGIFINILPFLGSYNTWKNLMTRLCKGTSETWESYAKTFRKFRAPESKILCYIKGEIDQDFYNYLLNTKLPENTRVVVKINSLASYNLCLDLLYDIQDK